MPTFIDQHVAHIALAVLLNIPYSPGRRLSELSTRLNSLDVNAEVRVDLNHAAAPPLNRAALLPPRPVLSCILTNDDMPMDLADVIWLSQPREREPDTAGQKSLQNEVLVYFIPGNPGLIEYYRAFFDHLSSEFKTNRESVRYRFVGYSLAGYELHQIPNENHLPLSLQDQAKHVKDAVSHTATIHQRTRRGQCEALGLPPPRPLPILLVGHSVGTYIMLEVIAQRQSEQKEQHSLHPPNFEIVGGICLFPTIIDLAKSPTGKKVSTIATSTYLAPTLHTLAKMLCSICPHWLLLSIVRRITGQNEGAAKVTTAFLRSKYGVLQALYMARFELLDMTHDKWADDVWNGPVPYPASANEARKDGSDLPKFDRPRLYFYWGENDHWIDNSTRDSVIATRAAENGPRMELDTNGTPHDFCITDENSKLIAEKVAGYVREVVSQLQK